jgi:uncharacterized protein (TIGR02147 family)
MIFDRGDYRSILKERLAQRQQRNRAYSLRAFARDVGLSPSRLSEVLSGKHALSPAKAGAVAARLGLSESEQAFFADLVEAASSRSAHAREKAARRVEEARSEAMGDDLAPDRFALVSKWHHFALVELAKLRDFKPRVPWIAGALGISAEAARTAVARLVRLGFLARRGKALVVTTPRTRTRSATPSAAIRDYQGQLLAKASEALEFQGIDERDVSSVVLAIDADRLDAARERLAAFRRDFAAEFAKQQGGTSVYCLAVQLFRLDKLPRQRP